jgi:alkylresorcinol/alkylpyrone synthase
MAHMTQTTYYRSANRLTAQQRGAPRIAGTAVAFPGHRYDQDQVAAALTEVGGPEFMRFASTAGVDTRSLALPLSRYPKLTGFTEANSAYVEVAVDLGERAVLSALDAAGLGPADVDVIARRQANPIVRTGLRGRRGRIGAASRLSPRLSG